IAGGWKPSGKQNEAGWKPAKNFRFNDRLRFAKSASVFPQKLSITFASPLALRERAKAGRRLCADRSPVVRSLALRVETPLRGASGANRRSGDREEGVRV